LNNSTSYISEENNVGHSSVECPLFLISNTEKHQKKSQGGEMARAKKDLYKITILNWEKHNPSAKKSFKKTLIDNNFCDDARLNVLPLTCKWLYLALLLTCGDKANNCITMSHQQVNAYLSQGQGAYNALLRLQQLQLLTFEKIALLEEKRREEKRRESTQKIKPKKQPELFDEPEPS
jgi:hypothetical protein